MEMEFTNLFLTKDMKTEKKFLNQYSTSPEERQHLIEYILNNDVFDLGEIDETNENKENVVSRILKTYFETLGLKVTFDEDNGDIVKLDDEEITIDNNDDDM
jgi:hypothetical protein